MALRRLSPGGYEYLTGSVACADRELEAGESLSDYYLSHGYPAGEWFGAGAALLGVSGEVSAAQMNALFGEGRHPDADRIEAEMIAAGASSDEALRATRLGRRFAQYGGVDELRRQVGEAYKRHNRDHGRPVGAPLDEHVRSTIRRRVQADMFAGAHEGRPPSGDNELTKWLANQKRGMKSAVAGYEVVFGPPKSVSVAWALGDDATRELIAGLHRQAVKDTLTHLEKGLDLQWNRIAR
jgi:TrwC relaxase